MKVDSFLFHRSIFTFVIMLLFIDYQGIKIDESP